MAEVKDNPIINATVANARASAQNTQSALDISNQLDRQEEISHDITRQFERANQASQIIIAQQNAFAAETETEKAAARTVLGSSYAVAGSESNYWAAEAKRNAHMAYAMVDGITEKKSKTLLNDPLGWIDAQFTLPTDIAVYNAYAEKNNIAEARLNEISRASNAAAINANAHEKKTSQELAIAKGAEAAALSQINVNKVLQDAAGTRIKGILELNSLSAQQSQLAYQALSASNEQERLKLARQSAEDQRIMRQLALAQRKDVLDAKAAERADLEAFLVERNAGAKAKGYYTIDSVDTFRREFAAKKNDPAYQDMISSGQLIVANKGVVSGIMLGQNAGEIARNYSAAGTNIKGNPVGSFLAQVWDLEKQSPTAPKDPNAFTAGVTDSATKRATAMLSRVVDGQANIYSAPPPKVILSNPNVAANNFIKDTLVQMVSLTPEMTIDDNEMVAKALDYVKGDPGKLAAASAGLTYYYRQAILANNMNNRYKENGLPEQTKYTAKIMNMDVNLADEATVKRLILQGLVKQSGLSILPKLGQAGNQ